MAANKVVRSGPVALTTTTTTNLFNPPTLTGGTNPPASSTNSYFVLRHMRIVNGTNGAIQVATWLGTTGINTVAAAFGFGGVAAAGTLTQGVSIPAQSYADWYGQVRIDAADYLVGGASSAGCTITLDGEIGVT